MGGSGVRSALAGAPLLRPRRLPRGAGLTVVASKDTWRPLGLAAVGAAGVAPTSNCSCLMVLCATGPAAVAGGAAAAVDGTSSPVWAAAAARALVAEKLRRLRMDLRFLPVAGAASAAAARVDSGTSNCVGALTPGVAPSRLGMRTARAVRPVRLGVWVRRTLRGASMAAAAPLASFSAEGWAAGSGAVRVRP